MHEVLVNRLGGLSLPRKSVVRLTDRPDMTLDVYRGRKTTIQQERSNYILNVFNTGTGGGGGSCGAMVLRQHPVPGRPTIWMTIGQGPIVLAAGAGAGCFDIFTLVYPFSPLSPSLWEMARYILKYCLKGQINPKQSTNQQHGHAKQ